MTSSVEGDYFEVCNCDVSCNCVGMDGQEPAVVTNAPFGAVTQPVRQARAKDVSYHGHWGADFSGTNSFVTDFRYEG